MFSKRTVLWLVLSLALVFSVSCSKKDEDDTSSESTDSTAASTAKGPAYKPTGDEGTVSGVISFNGAAPTPKKIQMDSDPVCSQKNPNAVLEDVVVADGKLANVFVYVKNPPNFTFDTPTSEVELDQIGCHYSPHVIAVQTNQPIKVVNSDATNHNIHPTPKDNREWNESQPPSAPPIIKTFARAEVLIPVKCNQHSWMKAWIGVLDHPFFAVSGKDGSFTIKGLPPGEYEINAWHEKLGTKSAKIKVDAKGAAKVDFSFDAATALNNGNAGAMAVKPALVLP